MNTTPIICGRGNPCLPECPPASPPPRRIIQEKTSGTFVSQLRKKVSREIVWKNDLDNFFWADPHQHWGEVFFLEWKNRGPILHLDFNSMYPFQLTQLAFHHPKTLQCQKGNWTPQILNHQINHGVFLCLLTQKEKNPDRKWFAHHHYLRYHHNQRSHHFLWPKNSSVLTLLHAQDIQALHPHTNILTQWGIFDPDCQEINHPLKHTVEDLLGKKAETSNPLEKSRTKLLLVQACSDQSQIHKNPFKNQEAARYTLGIPSLPNPQWWKGPRNSTAHSLFSPIKAASRAQLFSLAHFLHKREAQILRCHTDGLSIGCQNQSHLGEILHELSPQIASHPGTLKTSQAQEGFFLGPAIWWTNNLSSSGKRQITEYAGADTKDPFLTETVYQKAGETLINNALLLEENSKTLCEDPQGLKRWNRTTPQKPKEFREKRNRSRQQRLKYYLKYKEKIQNSDSA